MKGTAKGSPTTRGIVDIESRVAKLTEFETWGDLKPLDFAAIVGEDTWKRYWDERDAVEALMFAAQTLAANINTRITLRQTSDRSRDD